MAVSVTHAFVSPVADAGNPDEVGPNEWNAAHTVDGLGTAAEADAADFATAAQGAKADTALQPADIGVTVQAYDADLTAWAGVSPSSYSTTAQIAAAYQPLDADLTDWAGVNPSSYSTTAQIAAAYQPLDADLTSWAGVTRAAGFDTFAATPSSANLRALLSDEEGTGAAYFVGGALGTPSSATLTNATGLPVAGITASTSTALGVGSVELGHATDTTISRGAAGFIAVEGKRVPSPASQASGDLLYRGTTEWERLAKGTAGQVLTMNAGATAPEWAAAGGGGGMTLLGTLTTTSGTTHSLTNITAGYQALYCVFNGVSSNTGTTDTLRVQLSSTNGAAYGSAVSASAAIADSALVHGALWVNNISSTTAAAKTLLNALTNPPTSLSVGISTNTAAVVDAIRFTWQNAAAFDAGTILIYGVR